MSHEKHQPLRHCHSLPHLLTTKFVVMHATFVLCEYSFGLLFSSINKSWVMHPCVCVCFFAFLTVYVCIPPSEEGSIVEAFHQRKYWPHTVSWSGDGPFEHWNSCLFLYIWHTNALSKITGLIIDTNMTFYSFRWKHNLHSIMQSKCKFGNPLLDVVKRKLYF